MARPSLPSSRYGADAEARLGCGVGAPGTALGLARSLRAQPAGAPAARRAGLAPPPGARFRELRVASAGRRRPRPPRGRRHGAARNLDTFTCLKLFINSPGGARLWLRCGRAPCAPVVWLLRAAHMLNRLTCLG
ncbi:Hypothetical predicted protein [Marmota monax]|uniref:Uncharacterized protein n=1 Tax=Marmota monax TaxID=9995 RepID=A0A5E4C4J3_MARMO|nr:Hypothetical predicted protein [Marmota monax]